MEVELSDWKVINLLWLCRYAAICSLEKCLSSSGFRVSIGGSNLTSVMVGSKYFLFFRD